MDVAKSAELAHEVHQHVQPVGAQIDIASQRITLIDDQNYRAQRRDFVDGGRYGLVETDRLSKIGDRESTRPKSSHSCASRMPSSACKEKTKSLPYNRRLTTITYIPEHQ